MEITVKKLSALLLCLLMIVTCALAGCAGFEIDKVKYYNEVLATVGETTITRFELLSAYNSYGSNYYSSSTNPLEETLTTLINQELLYQYGLSEDETFKPTPYQVNKLVQELFDDLDESMEKYISTAKSMMKIENDISEETSTDEESAYLKENYFYTPRAKVELVIGNYEIVYIVEKDPEYPEEVDRLLTNSNLENFTSESTLTAIQEKYLSHLMDKLQAEEKENANALYEKVLSLFAKNLISYEHYLRDENGNAYSKVTSELLRRYFERTFNSRIKAQYINNIRTDYLEHETLSISSLVDEFDYIYNLDYSLYSDDFASYATKLKNIGTKGDSVVYHPTTDSQFGYFIHTLISFGDLKDKFTALENEKDEEKYEIEYNKLLSQVVVHPRNTETGLVDEDVNVTLSEVFEEFKAIQTETEYDKKLNKFIDFMFKYTGDASSTLVSGMPYVVGTNGNSAMEANFTQEAISLMTNGQAGAVSQATVGDVDSWCITSYGIHFLMYVDDVAAYDVDPANIPNGSSAAYYLSNKILNPLTGKTYFDMLFDSVYPASSSDEVYTSKTGYSDYESILIEDAKSEFKVEKFATKIKATKTSL